MLQSSYLLRVLGTHDCDLEWPDPGHASQKDLLTSRPACSSSISYYSRLGLHRMFPAWSSLALQLILIGAFTLHHKIVNRAIQTETDKSQASLSPIIFYNHSRFTRETLPTSIGNFKMVWHDEERTARQPFLGQDDQRLDENIGIREDGEVRQMRPHTPLLSRKSYVPILAHVVVLAIYSYIFIYVVGSRDKSCASCGSLIYCTRINQCIT